MRPFNALEAINEAIEKDTSLRPLQKARLKFRMKFDAQGREQAVGMITAECCAHGLVDEDGRELMGAVDWAAIIALIMEWLPRILDLFKK